MDIITAMVLNIALAAIALVGLYYVIRAAVAAGIQLDRDRQAERARAASQPVSHLDRDGL